MTRLLITVLLLAVLVAVFATLQPADAKSFKGMVLQLTAYSITVQHNPDDIKVFQIRAETERSPDVVAEDIVKVQYHSDNGILIADKIELKRKKQ